MELLVAEYHTKSKLAQYQQEAVKSRQAKIAAASSAQASLAAPRKWWQLRLRPQPRQALESR